MLRVHATTPNGSGNALPARASHAHPPAIVQRPQPPTIVPFNRARSNHPTTPTISLDPQQAFIKALTDVVARTAGGVLAGRGEFARTHGLSFPTSNTLATGFLRDIYRAFGYNEKLSYADYKSRWERGGMAETVVNLLADLTWPELGRLTVVEDEDLDNNTPWEDDVNSFLDRTNAAQKFHRADKLCRLGRYSVVFVGVNDSTDIATQMPALRSLDDVLWLQPLSEGRATFGENDLDTDVTSPRFGLPKVYTLDLGGSRTSQKVHWSRIIHVAEGLMEDELFGTPALRAAWNTLVNIERVECSGTEATWRHSDRGMQADVDPELVEFDEDAQEALTAEMQAAVHGFENFMLTRGVTLKDLGTKSVGFGANLDALTKLVSIITRYPKQWLEGSQRGLRSSEKDTDNFNRTIRVRRARFAEPVLVKATINRVASYGAITNPPTWDVDWGDSDEAPLADRIEQLLQLTEANDRQQRSTGEPVTSSNELRDKFLGWGTLDEAGVGVGGGNGNSGGNGGNGNIDNLRSSVVAFSNPNPNLQQRHCNIHEATNHHTTPLAQHFLDIVAAAKSSNQPLWDGADTIDKAEVALIATLAQVELNIAESLPDRLLLVLEDAANAELALVKTRNNWLTPDIAGLASGLASGLAGVDLTTRHAAIEFDFISSNPRAVAWAQARAGELLKDLSLTDLTSVRQLISTSLDGGMSHAQLVKHLYNVVGLDHQQIVNGANFISNLKSAKPGTVVKSGGYKVTTPDVVDNDFILKHITNLTDIQAKQRALNVAISEKSKAANQGLFELQVQAVDEGEIDPTDVERVYLKNTERHADRDGQRVAIGERFPVEPGENPRCACTHGLARVVH